MAPCSGWPMMVTDTRMWAEEGDGDPDEMLSLHYTRCHHSGVTLVTMQTVSGDHSGLWHNKGRPIRTRSPESVTDFTWQNPRPRNGTKMTFSSVHLRPFFAVFNRIAFRFTCDSQFQRMILMMWSELETCHHDWNLDIEICFSRTVS